LRLKTDRDPVRLFRPLVADETFSDSTTPFCSCRENVLKPRSATVDRDQTTGFDHVGISLQPDLLPVLPVKLARDAQASSCRVGLMENRKPSATPYLLAAVAIAVVIWTTMGAPHHSLKTVKQQYAGRVVVP
jgi:hypothetical protein